MVMPRGPRYNLAIDLDGVLTEHPRPLAMAASQKFGLDLPERAFVDSAGLNVPQTVRDWVYSDEGPASQTASRRQRAAVPARCARPAWPRECSNHYGTFG